MNWASPKESSMNPTEITTRRTPKERVALWRPKDAGPGDEDAICCVRTLVAGLAGEIEDARDAGTLLTTALGFARWLKDEGHRLSSLSAADLADGTIERFITARLHMSPRGTKDATASRLRFLRTSPALATSTSTEPPQEPAVVSPLALTEQVSWVLANYVPDNVEPARFERVAALVRCAAARCEPAQVDRAVSYVRYGTYLAAWCDEQCLPLRTDVVFHPDTVEKFMAALAGQLPTGSLATISWCLHKMAQALHPTLLPAQKAAYPKAKGATKRAPYSAEQVARLLQTLRTVKNPRIRRQLRGLVGLGLGAGAKPGEHNAVEAKCVTKDTSDVVWVEFDNRRVPVKEPYGAMLFDAATQAVAAGETYIIGSSANPQRNRASYLCTTTSAWDPPIDIYLMRNTFLVERACEPHTLVGLLTVTGLSGLEAFETRLESIRAAHAARASEKAP